MIVEVALLSFALSCPPRQCSTDEKESVFVFDSNSQSVDLHQEFHVVPEMAVAGDLKTALARDLASIPEVCCVLTEKAEGNLLVWIAIDKAEAYEVRSRVYEKELGLLDGFPEVNFDFNLIPAGSRNPREIATGAQVVYSRP
jgi:hypothetical protein